MPTLLDTEKLASMLKSKRGSQGLRAIAKEIGGVSASTLSRIEQGNVPDVETFLKLCKWLEVSTNEFSSESNNSSKSLTTEEIVVAHLRADKTLPKKTIEALTEMINIAYNKH